MRSLAREFSLGGVILFARNIEAPEQVAELSHDVQALAVRAAALGQRRSGRRPRRAPAGRRSPSGRRWRCSGAAATRRWRRGSRRRWPPSCGRSASRSTTRRCSTSTPTRRTRSSAIARWPRTPERWRALGAAIIRGLQDNGVAACGKHFPGTRRHLGRFAPRAAARRASARSDPARRVRAVPRGDHGRRGVHHDRARAGAVARRGAAGHAVAADRPGAAARGAGLSTA